MARVLLRLRGDRPCAAVMPSSVFRRALQSFTDGATRHFDAAYHSVLVSAQRNHSMGARFEHLAPQRLDHPPSRACNGEVGVFIVVSPASSQPCDPQRNDGAAGRLPTNMGGSRVGVTCRCKLDKRPR